MNGLAVGVYLLLLISFGNLLCPLWSEAAKGNVTKTLKILTLVPFFDSSPNSGWSRGLELLPMGRIARNEINEREDILPGYDLEIIEASSDGCGYSVITKALVNFASNAIGLNGNSTVIGVTGLACSTVTTSVSPLAGREEVSVIQMSMSNSPDLRSSSEYPHLWRTLSSSIVFVNGTLALMDRLNWSKISTIYDENRSYFSTTGKTLVNEVTKNASQSVILDIGVDQFEDFIDSAADQVKSNGARIIFTATTILESVLIMCAAAKKELTWPGYQWIFYGKHLRQFVSKENVEATDCDEEQISAALENVILWKWQLSPDDVSKTVYSGKSVHELQDLYFKELKSLTEEEQYIPYANEFSFQDQPWAYPLYDETWAFALALNLSLPDLEAINFSLSDYHFGNKLVTQIIEKHLATVSFEGIVGHISFDIHHEAQTSITLYQIKNGTEVLIGGYNKLKGLILHNVSYEDFPDDDYEEEYREIPPALRIILYLSSVIIFLLITVFLILTLYYHRSPVIRANSILLNSLIFSGCYCICCSSLASILLLEAGLGETYFVTFCNIQIWGWSIGMSLILGTNLVKLGRIYRVFTHFGQSGTYLTNCALFIYVLLLGIFTVLLLLVWSIVDTLHYEQDSTFFLDQNPPHVKYVTRCTCQHYALWVSALLLYFGLMLVTMIFFAFQTRKIKHGHFKDTKKIFFFVFFLFFTLIFSISLWIILREISPNTEYYGAVVQILGNFTICLLFLGFLIAPKALPVLYQHVTTGTYKASYTRRRSTTRTTRLAHQSSLARMMSNL